MKILVTKQSIYFFGKVKDLKEELTKYNKEGFSVKDLINRNLH